MVGSLQRATSTARLLQGVQERPKLRLGFGESGDFGNEEQVGQILPGIWPSLLM
jgi:hypothetical protein